MIRQRGFSLIELMVAVTLALIVTAAVLSVFVGSRNAFMSTSGMASIADGGRFALTFIQNSVRNAGYMGCATSQTAGVAAGVAPAILNSGTPAPVDSFIVSFGQGLGGFEANNTNPGASYTVSAPPVTADAIGGDWVSGLDLAFSGLVVKNNDVLVVRSTVRSSSAPALVTAIADGTNGFTVNALGSPPLQQNQLAVISDCVKFVAFQVSGINGSSPSITIGHASGGSPGNSGSAFPVSFQNGAEVTPVDTVAYYIGRGADGDGALFAWDLNSPNAPTQTEIVPDIEAMQVLYGIDTTGSQTVSEYVTANNVLAQAVNGEGFNGVMSVKVAVLAASAPGAVPKPAAATTYNLLGTLVTAPIDTRARQVFDITIGLRNLVP